MTRPKSRSILTSLATRTAKPAIAVAPEANTARPVRAYAARRASSGPCARALLIEARREDDRELGGDRDRQRAERGGHRVQRYPRRPEHEGRPAAGQEDRHQRQQRPGNRAAHEQQHEGDPEQTDDRQQITATGEVAGRGRRDHRQAGELDVDSRGRAAGAAGHSDLGPDAVDQLLLGLERLGADPEADQRRVARKAGRRVGGRDLIEVVGGQLGERRADIGPAQRPRRRRRSRRAPAPGRRRPPCSSGWAP